MPPAHAANGRRLIRSVSGSLHRVLMNRDAQMVLADSVISLYMVYGSTITKNYPTQDEILCLRLTPELAGKKATMVENWAI